MFGWFSGKSKSNLPEPTALQVQRTKQIEQLNKYRLNLTEIQRDVEYRVTTTVNSSTLYINITLPANFPQERPVVRVSPPASHPWLDDHMLIVRAPGINNFMVHSDLGKEIQTIVEEFQRNPPTMNPQQFSGYPGYPYGAPPTTATQPTTLPQTQPGYGYPTATSQPTLPGYMASLPASTPAALAQPPAYTPASSAYTGPPNYGIPNLHNNVQPQLPGGPAGGYQMPVIPTSLAPQIQHLSMLELQELLDDEDKMLQMLGEMTELQKIASDRQQMTEVNEETAKSNLSKKPELEENKKILLEKYDRYNEVKQEYDQHSQRQDTLRKRYDHSVIHDRLKGAAQTAEAESETIAENFLDGKIPVDEFKKNYMDKRKLSNLRNAKVERLAHMRGTVL